jgi:hypothetical protein
MLFIVRGRPNEIFAWPTKNFKMQVTG